MARDSTVLDSDKLAGCPEMRQLLVGSGQQLQEILPAGMAFALL